jgi:hypothetical protein
VINQAHKSLKVSVCLLWSFLFLYILCFAYMTNVKLSWVGSIARNDENIGYVYHKIQAEWIKCESASGAINGVDSACRCCFTCRFSIYHILLTAVSIADNDILLCENFTFWGVPLC